VAGRLGADSELSSLTRRTPCGPSDTISAGMPSRSTGVVDQALRPGAQGGFFFQRHLRNQRFVLHASSLLNQMR
jgi:hypothetical protein